MDVKHMFCLRNVAIVLFCVCTFFKPTFGSVIHSSLQGVSAIEKVSAIGKLPYGTWRRYFLNLKYKLDDTKSGSLKYHRDSVRGEDEKIQSQSLDKSILNEDLQSEGSQARIVRSSSETSECGINKITVDQLEKTDDSKRMDWPWIVSLYSGTPKCGGVLLDSKHVLSAAHCLYDKDPEEYEVRSGLYDLTVDDYQRSDISQVIYYDNTKDRADIKTGLYDHTNYRHDIVIVELETPINMTPAIRPICLSSFNIVVNDSSRIAGWGSNSTDPFSFVLLEVSIPIWDVSQCKESFTNKIVPEEVICAAAYSGGKDACQGDSGGPLIATKSGRWISIGIVSYGFHCGVQGAPGVYTKVEAYMDWIKEVIGQ